MNRTSNHLIAAFSVASALATPVSACPTRHFYNHSPVSFGIDFPSAQGTCSIGNSGNLQTCTIPSGSTAELHYPEIVIYRTTHIDIESLESGSRKYFPKKNFTIDFDCEILHGGSTGNIVLNDPTYGDIQTCGRLSGGGYDCRY